MANYHIYHGDGESWIQEESGGVLTIGEWLCLIIPLITAWLDVSTSLKRIFPFIAIYFIVSIIKRCFSDEFLPKSFHFLIAYIVGLLSKIANKPIWDYVVVGFLCITAAGIIVYIIDLVIALVKKIISPQDKGKKKDRILHKIAVVLLYVGIIGFIASIILWILSSIVASCASGCH